MEFKIKDFISVKINTYRDQLETDEEFKREFDILIKPYLDDKLKEEAENFRCYLNITTNFSEIRDGTEVIYYIKKLSRKIYKKMTYEHDSLNKIAKHRYKMFSMCMAKAMAKLIDL